VHGSNIYSGIAHATLQDIQLGDADRCRTSRGRM
jgi:hypothetical protein